MANKINTTTGASNAAKSDASQNKGPKSPSSFGNDASRKIYESTYKKNK